MITVVVTYHCKEGKKDEFIKSIQSEGIDKASQAEAGNRHYNYYLPVDGGNDVLLIEKWADADALATHGQAAHYKRLQELKAQYVASTDISKFED